MIVHGLLTAVLGEEKRGTRRERAAPILTSSTCLWCCTLPGQGRWEVGAPQVNERAQKLTTVPTMVRDQRDGV